MSREIKHLYRFGPFGLDLEKRSLFRGEEPVPLTPKALDTLIALVEKRGEVVEKDDLMREVWGDTVVEEGNLTFNIHRVRKALGEWKNGEWYIQTVPGQGYRFVAPVVVGEAPVVPRSREQATSAQAANRAATLPAQAEPVAVVAVPGLRSKRWLYVLFAGVVLVALVVFALRPNPQSSPQKFVQITHDGRNKGGPIVTDGTRLYFTEDVEGDLRPSQVLISGGETAAISTPLHNFFLSDISPDHSELLGAAPFASDAGAQLWTVPLLGGSPRRIGNLKGRDATWSPDGRQIAYVNGPGLFVADSDGSEAHQIFTVPSGHLFWPRWSPRGNSLRFEIASSGDDSTSSLWEISADGKGLRRLLARSNVPPTERAGNWTRDGKWFMFASERSGNWDLWALPQRLIPIPGVSSEPIQMTAGSENLDAPTPSKDGKQVFAIGEKETGELSRYDASHDVFEPYFSGMPAVWMSFTRDRQWIAYIQYPERTLWRMRANGSDRKQLTFAPTQVSGYSWSPDGTRLAICEPWKIGLISRDGGQINYPISSSLRLGIPSWSQDGSRLVFGEVPLVFGQDDGTHAIHIFDLKTKQIFDLPGSKGLWTARSSPDGRYTAALTITTQDLVLFDWETKRWRDLDAGPVDNLTWSSDSRYVYYDTPPGGAPNAAIYRVRIADGHLDRVTSLGGLRRAVAWWSGLDEDDSPLIVRDIGIQEIYALDVNWP